ncbi:MAG: GNAT family N-acetyltransferase [Planctomycetes bacterium]|nr:GNAT family N-acetyltransferase [Planctomycetota bacterium]
MSEPTGSTSSSSSSRPTYGSELEVRTADPVSDNTQVWSLYEDGLLEGQIGENDSGADILNLADAYFNDEGWSHFWVAELCETPASQIIGMVGIQQADEHTAEIRRLRVHPEHRQRGVGARLMEVVLAFCREKGYLKVVLDTRVERAAAVALFRRFGFQLNRQRDVKGKVVLDFYLDLYRQVEDDNHHYHS